MARGRTLHLHVLIGRLSHRSQALCVAGAKESVPSPAGSFGSGLITSQGDAAASQHLPSQEGWRDKKNEARGKQNTRAEIGTTTTPLDHLPFPLPLQSYRRKSHVSWCCFESCQGKERKKPTNTSSSHLPALICHPVATPGLPQRPAQLRSGNKPTSCHLTCFGDPEWAASPLPGGAGAKSGAPGCKAAAPGASRRHRC